MTARSTSTATRSTVSTRLCTPRARLRTTVRSISATIPTRIAGAVSGTGSFNLSNGSTLTFGAGVSSGETVTFVTASSKLILDFASPFSGTINEFSTKGDEVLAQGFSESATTFVYTQTGADRLLVDADGWLEHGGPQFAGAPYAQSDFSIVSTDGGAGSGDRHQKQRLGRTIGKAAQPTGIRRAPGAQACRSQGTTSSSIPITRTLRLPRSLEQSCRSRSGVLLPPVLLLPELDLHRRRREHGCGRRDQFQQALV